MESKLMYKAEFETILRNAPLIETFEIKFNAPHEASNLITMINHWIVSHTIRFLVCFRRCNSTIVLRKFPLNTGLEVLKLHYHELTIEDLHQLVTNPLFKINNLRSKIEHRERRDSQWLEKN